MQYILHTPKILYIKMLVRVFWCTGGEGVGGENIQSLREKKGLTLQDFIKKMIFKFLTVFNLLERTFGGRMI